MTNSQFADKQLAIAQAIRSFARLACLYDEAAMIATLMGALILVAREQLDVDTALRDVERAIQHARKHLAAKGVRVALDTTITPIECPSCLAPVFVPADSDAERVDCTGCDARLVTARTIDGVTAFELEPAVTS